MKTTMTNKYISRLLIPLLGLSISGEIMAATGNIAGTVLAALTVTPGVNMDFGSIVATGNVALDVTGTGAVNGTAQPNNSAYLDLALDGARTVGQGPGASAVISLLPGAGTPATFAVTGEPNTLLRFTSPLMLDLNSSASTTPLAAGGHSFLLTDLILDTDGDTLMNNDVLVADPAGKAATGFTVWGTTDAVTGQLSVSAAGRVYTTLLGLGDNASYPDNPYVGSVDIVISY